jgi:late competence protein required for DNA uptake (superfamily II DNA/RNA helicase)
MSKEATAVIDESSMHHCGQCFPDAKLHERMTKEQLDKHNEEVAHTKTGSGKCQRCGKENVEFVIIMKHKIGEPIPVYCDDCIAAIAAQNEKIKAGQSI